MGRLDWGYRDGQRLGSLGFRRDRLGGISDFGGTAAESIPANDNQFLSRWAVGRHSSERCVIEGAD